MRKDRLLKLADFLETVVAKKPRYKFDMGTWSDPDFDPNHCHTTACAFGWATVKFPKLLKLDRDGGIEYKDHFGFDAVSSFFQISDKYSVNLFGVHNGGKTPKLVAKNIRKFVEGKNE